MKAKAEFSFPLYIFSALLFAVLSYHLI